MIDIFLLFAIDGSREKYPHENNVIFHEEVLTHPNIPGLGQISGPVDYLIGPSALNLPINTPVPTSSNLLVPGNSVFLVVEAKKASTVADQESVAQVLAQLLALELAEDR